MSDCCAILKSYMHLVQFGQENTVAIRKNMQVVFLVRLARKRALFLLCKKKILKNMQKNRVNFVFEGERPLVMMEYQYLRINIIGEIAKKFGFSCAIPRKRTFSAKMNFIEGNYLTGIFIRQIPVAEWKYSGNLLKSVRKSALCSATKWLLRDINI